MRMRMRMWMWKGGAALLVSLLLLSPGAWATSEPAEAPAGAEAVEAEAEAVQAEEAAEAVEAFEAEDAVEAVEADEAGEAVPVESDAAETPPVSTPGPSTEPTPAPPGEGYGKIGASDDVRVPTKDEIEDAVPEGTRLTGKQIYEKYQETRLVSGIQYQKVISTDPGGSEQTSRFWVRWKDFRDENNKPVDGVIAKTVVHFLDPYDMRHTGVLVVANAGRDPDQFVYQPSTRKVRRVKLDGVGVGGTDFQYSDIAFNNLEAADYIRQADEEYKGAPVYVVTATLKPFINAEYRTTVAYFEQEHYIPLHIIYTDDSGVKVREMEADPDSIKQFDEAWIATRSTMTNLKEGTSSRVTIEKLEPNVELAESLFSVFRLHIKQ